MPVDVKDLFNVQLKNAVSTKPDDAKKIGGVYQINIAGAGTWTIDLAADAPGVTDGPASNPGCTIDIAEEDFQKLLEDPKQGMSLFFQGKLKVKGNQMLAMNLQKLFALR